MAPSSQEKEKGNVQLSVKYQALILASGIWSLWGEPSWDMNSWLQALQNAHGVNVTSDKALRQRRETHAGSMLGGRVKSDSWTNRKYSCSGGWGLKKKKKCNQPLEEINEFLSEESDPKTHFSVQWGQEPILGSWQMHVMCCEAVPTRDRTARGQQSSLGSQRLLQAGQGWFGHWKTT